MGTAKVNNLRMNIYNIIDNDGSKDDNGGETERGTKPSSIFDMFLMVLILANVVAVVIGSVDVIYERHSRLFASFEIFSITIFTFEYLLRLWTAPLKLRGLRGEKGLDNNTTPYWRSVYGVIDLLAILPFFVPYIYADLRVIRILRIFRLLRVLKLLSFGDSGKMIVGVLKTQKMSCV